MAKGMVAWCVLAVRLPEIYVSEDMHSTLCSASLRIGTVTLERCNIHVSQVRSCLRCLCKKEAKYFTYSGSLGRNMQL